MMDRIKFQDNNHTYDNVRKDWNDLEWINEFYSFLQGEMPEGTTISNGHKPKMSSKKANTIIWYLQEHLRILPDNIEKCSSCDELYDSNSGGIYWETKGKHYCAGCSDQVPYNYDKGRR